MTAAEATPFRDRPEHERGGTTSSRFRVLLGSLLALLLLYPLGDLLLSGDLLLHGLATIVLLTGVLAVAGGGRSLSVAVCLALLSAAGDLAVLAGAGPWASLAALASEAAFELWVDLVVLRAVLTADRVTVDTLAGGVCAYLLTGMAFASIYSIVEAVWPGSFAFPAPVLDPAEWADFVFFSFTTLTTLGYGDIRPVTDMARSLTSAESILGVFYMAVLVSRLVAAYEERPTLADPR